MSENESVTSDTNEHFKLVTRDVNRENGRIIYSIFIRTSFQFKLLAINFNVDFHRTQYYVLPIAHFKASLA